MTARSPSAHGGESPSALGSTWQGSRPRSPPAPARIFSEAEKAGYFVKTKDGADFDGWCWPGSSSYLDMTSPQVRSWWSDQLSLSKYQGSTGHLYIWNDMNEPSVFNGPEITMQKDNKHFGGVEHRCVLVWAPHKPL